MTLTEVKENHCVDLLAKTFGMLYTEIEKDFAALDKNGDGVVSIEEALYAYKTFGMDLNRSNDLTLDDLQGPFFKDPVHGNLEVKDSWGFVESDLALILSIAIHQRAVHISSNTYNIWQRRFVIDVKDDLLDKFGRYFSCIMDGLPNGNYFLHLHYYFMFELEDNTFSLKCWNSCKVPLVLGCL